MNVDWSTWHPTLRTVLVFIVNNGNILLIRKKRGLGAGKINGPGGKVEPNEIPWQAAIREVREEIGVTPVGLEAMGELSFQFADGLAMYCVVFRAANYRGLLQETEEATPVWVPLHKIPFEEMWADDAHWFPYLLQGERFRGFFTLDVDKLLSAKVEAIPVN
jgi:8-oxo-dGTP diphosphatase